MTKDQIITEKYAIYNSDSNLVLPSVADGSIDFSVYSPPFRGLYQYSSSINDLSNCASTDEFMQQYEFIIEQISRVTKPGRISAVHIADIIEKDGDMYDLPGKVKEIHKRHGFQHRNTITIWKEPLKVRMRTMVKSLMHKLIVEDATECFTAMPDYVLIFKKKGENQVPVTHPQGLTDFEYFGENPFLKAHEETYGQYEDFKKKWQEFDGDPKENKMSHLTWQRYASSVWDDIRLDNVLPFQDGRDEDDERHVHALQLDVIDRLVYLYTNAGEVVLTPFMGVGSEVYSPVSLGRKAIGIELKESYFKQAIKNMENCKERFKKSAQLSLI